MEDNFDTIVRAVLAFLALLGTGWAGWQKWGKSRDESALSASKVTFDTILEVVEKLQSENDKKDVALVDAEKRCNDRIAGIEARMGTYEHTVARQVKIIDESEQEKRGLRTAMWEKDQEILRLKNQLGHAQ